MLEHAQPKGERARLSETLIENALNLTGKTMEDMKELKIKTPMRPPVMRWVFCIDKFCYYLLSPSFIEKYAQKWLWLWKNTYTVSWFSMIIWQATIEYQRRDEEYPQWNKTPLIELLSKICPTDQTM